MTARPLVVGIMGAGRIAQGYDAPGAPQVLTLAHAVRRSSSLRLGGFYDIDGERAGAAERKWSCAASPRERGAWLDHGWDVVCIATPEVEHASDLRDVLARKPRAVVIEKPVAIDPAEGTRLLRHAETLGIAVLVDFPRRWHTAVRALAGESVPRGVDDVGSRGGASARLGVPRAAVFAYSGDAIRAASHMLDLFVACWGGGWVVGRSEGSGGVVIVTLRRGETTVPVSFVAVPSDPYYLWEMHVYCERGKVELSHSPEMLEVSVPRPHPIYPTYDVLTTAERHDTESEPLLVRLMDTLADAIADPEIAAAIIRREIESHELGATVLRAVTTEAAVATRQGSGR